MILNNHFVKKIYIYTTLKMFSSISLTKLGIFYQQLATPSTKLNIYVLKIKSFFKHLNVFIYTHNLVQSKKC